jgi:hypothetical protein
MKTKTGPLTKKKKNKKKTKNKKQKKKKQFIPMGIPTD